MGANYGETGRNQGLNRSQTVQRNRYINAANQYGRSSREARRERRRFERMTGRSMREYAR